MKKTGLLTAVLFGVFATGHFVTAEDVRIEKKAAEFSSTTLSEKAKAEVVKSGYLKGCGEADYKFSVPETDWYELWVAAGGWGTDLRLDGDFLIHTHFDSGVWEFRGNPSKRMHKTMNLYLTKGAHTLTFSKLPHPGLPFMQVFYLEKAAGLSGKVRIVPQNDCLVFRCGQKFSAQLLAGMEASENTVRIEIVEEKSGDTVRTIEKKIPAGTGNYREQIIIPTDREGIFDLKVKDKQGNFLDRVTQFVVVDTARKPTASDGTFRKELIAEIDCTKKEPDYFNDPTRIIDSPVGAYRESGDKGYYQELENSSFFAYVLNLPAIQEPYLIEVDYPDDDERLFVVAVLEQAVCPYPVANGVVSGGPYSLSRKMQTLPIFFYPREKDPRLLFRNGHSGLRAAVSRIRIYRIKSGFPALDTDPAGRLFGMYFEEPLRFTTYFGARPTGKRWSNILEPAERWAQWSNFTGVNLWLPTISVYTARLWPSKILAWEQMDDEDSYALHGPFSLKDPLERDIMRLMLLTCEKYGLNFIGELNIVAYAGGLKSYMDKRFGGDGNTSDDDPQKKPWLIVSKDGKAGAGSTYEPYCNPLWPGVQDWAADVFQELADRYKDSPAFKGVAIRLMGWVFAGWQTFPSINWGYGDYTVGLFEKETGIKVPVKADDSDRSKKRYDWLMANAYEKWVDWRCRKIARYYQRVASILTEAGPDLKLYINACGPNYAPGEWVGDKGKRIRALDEKGWLGMIRESGIDPALYRNIPGIVLSDGRGYPPGAIVHGADTAWRAAAARDAARNPAPIINVSKRVDNGAVSSVRFGGSYVLEGPFPTRFVGWEKKKYKVGGDNKNFYICGCVNAPGRGILERYAASLADGNITFMSDGGLNYIGYPGPLQEFMAEYRRLPVMGMELYGNSGDPVALWNGKKDGKLYFYAVNRADYPVEAAISLTGASQVKYLSSGRKAKLADGKVLTCSLLPYQLAAFIAEPAGTAFAGFKAAVPEKVKTELLSQLKFTEKLAGGDTKGPTLIALSPSELNAGRREVDKAKNAYRKGRYWSVRKILQSHHLVRLYEAFGSYPPNLFQRKAPVKSQSAFGPVQLKEKAVPESAQRAKVLDAGTVSPFLAGEKVLTWSGDSISFQFQSSLANQYRLSFVYITEKPYARPLFFMRGRELRDTALPDEGVAWGEKTFLLPVSLSQGSHTLQCRKEKNCSAGLLSLCMEPLYMDITADKWMITGPFGGSCNWRSRGIDEEMDIVLPPEKERNLSTSYSGDKGQSISWVKSMITGDYVDLFKITGAFSHRVSYALVHIISPEERDAEIKFGVDYFAKIWLNGKEVFRITDGHGAPHKGEFTFPVKLHKGRNELLVKIHAGSRGNGFWLALTDPGDLTVQSHLE